MIKIFENQDRAKSAQTKSIKKIQKYYAEIHLFHNRAIIREILKQAFIMELKIRIFWVDLLQQKSIRITL